MLMNRNVRAAFLSLLLLTTAPSSAESLRGVVVRVKDGDTVVVLDGNKRQHDVRLSGIDAPEKRQAFGERSRQSLAELVHRKDVVVEWHKVDRWRRVIGKVTVSGRDANLEQVERGLAWHYKAYAAEQSDGDRVMYARAEARARERHLGLWRDAHPAPPWEWRHSRRQRAQRQYP